MLSPACHSSFSTTVTIRTGLGEVATRAAVSGGHFFSVSVRLHFFTPVGDLYVVGTVHVHFISVFEEGFFGFSVFMDSSGGGTERL